MDRRQRRMHRAIVTAVVVVLVPLLIWPAVGWVVWQTKAWTDVSVIVYDQTVPDAKYREHAALGLALESLKVPFSVDSGYVGAEPGGDATGTWPTQRPDLIMLIDAYGVYTNEQGQVDPEGHVRVSGVFDTADAAKVEAWYREGSLLYGEAAILGAPTPSSAAATLEKVFGVSPTGWVGRSFRDLATVPGSLRQGSWTYHGPGILLLKGERRIVLTADDLIGEVTVEGTVPSTGAFQAPFPGWFEVDTATAGVDAVLRLPVNTKGAAKIIDAGIPEEIPFIIRGERTVYVAGDASDAAVAYPLRRISGSATLLRWSPQSRDTAFYYRAYLPFVTWLVEEAQS